MHMCVWTMKVGGRCCNPPGNMFTPADAGMMQVSPPAWTLHRPHTPQQQLETLRTIETFQSHNLAPLGFLSPSLTLENWGWKKHNWHNFILILHSEQTLLWCCGGPIGVFCVSFRQTIVTNIFYISPSECCGNIWRMMSSKEEETLRFFQYVEENGLRAYNGLVAQNLDHARNERNRAFLQEKNDKKRKQDEAIRR